MKRTESSKSSSTCHAEALEVRHGEIVEPRRATFNRARTRRYLLYGLLSLLPVSGGASCPETPPSSTTVHNPQIGVDGTGKGISAWSENDGTQSSIYIKWYYGETIGWGSATLIESGNDDRSNPRVAMDAAGNATVVWSQWDGTAKSAYAARYDATTGWGGGIPIESVSNNVGSPRIAMDASGNAISVWVNVATGGNVIHANRYEYDAATGTGSWGSEVLIQGVSGNAQHPQIAMDASGNAIAVWMLYDPPMSTIKANRYIASTDSWSAEALIGYSYENDTPPRLAMNASGSSVAVWVRSDRTLTDNWVVANHYTGNWGTEGAVEYGSQDHRSALQVAMDASGNGIAVWEQWDGTTFGIYANRYTAISDSWELLPEPIESAGGNAYHPQIAMDDNGNAIAVWDMNGEIYSNCYDGSNWQTEVKIGTGDDPQIAMDNNVALAVWAQNDTIRDKIWFPPFCPGARGEDDDTDPGPPQPVPEICNNGIDDDGDGLVDCDDPDCASDPACLPEPSGACCLANGTCTQVTQANCTAGGGGYQGDGTTCTPNPCPQPPTGACCFLVPSYCGVMDETTCEDEGGTFQGPDTNCTPDPCPAPLGGACCFGSSCNIAIQEVCEIEGGNYQGDDTTCTPNPCP